MKASGHINALFVCSRNRWRSPTAERIWRDSQHVNVRARGLSAKAERVIQEEDVRWADVIFVMESEHRARLIGRFGDLVDRTRLVVLDIPDEYEFMDPQLVELLQSRVEAHLERLRS